MTDPSSIAGENGSKLSRLAYRACAALALVVWALGSAHSAKADTLLISPTDLFTGTEASGYSVSVPGPGTLYVDLSSIDYAPGVQADLSFILASGAKVLGSLTNVTGSESLPISVGSASTLFAYVIGDATGTLGLGMSSLDIVFRPDGMMKCSPVPLPPSAWLLLTGLAGLGGVLRFGQGRFRASTPLSA